MGDLQNEHSHGINQVAIDRPVAFITIAIAHDGTVHTYASTRKDCKHGGTKLALMGAMDVAKNILTRADK